MSVTFIVLASALNDWPHLFGLGFDFGFLVLALVSFSSVSHLNARR